MGKHDAIKDVEPEDVGTLVGTLIKIFKDLMK